MEDLTYRGASDKQELWADVETNSNKLLQQGANCCMTQLCKKCEQVKEGSLPEEVVSLLQQFSDVSLNNQSHYLQKGIVIMP